MENVLYNRKFPTVCNLVNIESNDNKCFVAMLYYYVNFINAIAILFDLYILFKTDSKYGSFGCKYALWPS